MSSDSPPLGQPEKPQKPVQIILVVDDREENRYLLQVMLEASGYLVVTAENGQEAHEMVKSEKIDAIISDILMPLVDGFQLCRAIKEDPEFAHIPFIFYSASYTEKKDREFGLSLGADEYITKPIEPVDFLAIITRVLSKTEPEEKDYEEKKTPDNLLYYSSYAEILGRKLDITVEESEQHKELARFNEEKYRVFLQNLQGIGYLIRTDEEIPIIFEGQIEEITGYPAIDFQIGTRKWTDIIHPDDKECYIRVKKETELCHARKFTKQYRIIHNNGEIRWLHDIASCLPGQDSDIILIQGAIYDTTLQKQAEEQIRLSEKKYRELVEKISDSIFTLNNTGFFTFVSPVIREITGFDPSHFINKHFLDFIYDDDRDDVDKWFKNFFLNNTTPVEFRILNSQNQVSHLRVKASQIRENDKTVGVTGIISDITAWKYSEEIKAERTKEVETLLALHLLTHKNEDDIFTYALQASLELTKSTIGFIALIREGGMVADFHIWSPEVMRSCLIRDTHSHQVTPSSGIWAECITTKKPIIINDFQSVSDCHGFPSGHVPIQRFLEVPILDGDQVSAVVAVANRIELYTDAHAKTLNTLGNTLWALVHRKRSDQEIKKALTQIAQNMEQLATLNDTIRNSLSVISALSDHLEEDDSKNMMNAVRNIDLMITRLDIGWVQSEKVKNFLIKHYNFTKDDF